MRYLAIHRDLDAMREEAERLSEQMDFNAPSSSSGSTDNPADSAPAQQQAPTSSAEVPNREAGVEGERVDNDDQRPKGLRPDLSKIPICLVCEPMDAKNVGKSTLCRILLNYATRRGRAPIFVDLDPDQGQIGLPGTIGALSIESPIDIEMGLELKSSMLMHFGHEKPSADIENKSSLYYNAIVESMAKVVHSKLEHDRKSYYSGVIINSSSWTEDNDYKLLVNACKAFQANMVIVVDSEVLAVDLQKDLEAATTVLNVPKTVDIHKSSTNEHLEMRYARIGEYFYGTKQQPFNPMNSEIKFAFLKRLIYKISNSLMLPDSLMPLGNKTQDNQVEVSQYECSASDLLHYMLAVSYCKIDDVVDNPESVLRSNIMGFICVTSVRGDGETVNILTPQKIPMDHVLLYSDIQYMDLLI